MLAGLLTQMSSVALPRTVALAATTSAVVKSKALLSTKYFPAVTDDGLDALDTRDKSGVDLLQDPIYNKGTGFKYRERDRHRLRGLVPPVHNKLPEQEERVYEAMNMLSNKDSYSEDISKHNFLMALQDRNEVLFYKLLVDRIKEMAPLVYTPTVGLACQKASMLFRRPRGMYFTYGKTADGENGDNGDMRAIIQNWPHEEVDVVVVTDGERILGLGDLGVDGMAIPIGKLAIYTAAGGIHPMRCLPVMLDVGTNCPTRLNRTYYMGRKKPRVVGDEYYEFMDEFMRAIKFRYPNALIQFEDFFTPKAENVLQRYKDDYCCFNDDIQGTGAVALAGMLSALRITKTPTKDIRIVCVGAGSAGVGVSRMLMKELEMKGVKSHEARQHFWMLDVDGLLTIRREIEGKAVNPGAETFLRRDSKYIEMEGANLLEVVKAVKPTLLLGLAGTRGLFSEEVVKEMSKHVERPIIFAMSNPTDKAECTAAQAYEWTDGRAVYASGSPFGPATVTTSKGKMTFQCSQANNMYIFPGLGLGVISSRARVVTDRMIYKAAETLANFTSHDDLSTGKVYPPIEQIRRVSHEIAVTVAKVAEQEGVARAEAPNGNWEEVVKRNMWTPHYPDLV